MADLDLDENEAPSELHELKKYQSEERVCERDIKYICQAGLINIAKHARFL